MDKIKQQAPNKIFKVDDPLRLKIEIANGHLEKPIAAATPKFDIRDRAFAEHFVVMKNLTEPIKGLHSTRHNSVVVDSAHGLLHFPHLTMQVKNANCDFSAKPQSVLTNYNLTIPPWQKRQSQFLLITHRNEIQWAL